MNHCSRISALCIWTLIVALLPSEAVFAQKPSGVDADPETPQATELEKDTRKFFRDLFARECRADSRLHGTWVWIDNRARSATVLVDEDHADQQLEIIKSWIENSQREVKPTIDEDRIFRKPFSTYLRRLHARLEAKLQHNGRFVHGAYFKNSDAGGAQEHQLSLVPFGHILKQPTANASQADECSNAARVLLQEMPEWRNMELQNGEIVDAISIDIDTKVKGEGETPSGNTFEYVKPSPSLVAIHKKLHTAIADEELLHGAWIVLYECYDYRGQSEGDVLYYDVELWLDELKVEAQRNLLAVRLDEMLHSDYKVVSQIDLPIANLVRQLSLNMESTSAFDGCMGEGFHFSPNLGENNEIGSVAIVPHARLGAEDQRQTLQNALEYFLFNTGASGNEGDNESSELSGVPDTRLPGWQSVSVLPKTSDDRYVFVVETSALRGASLYATALDHLCQFRFEEAEKDFQMAAIESPTMAAYRYWRIVALTLQEGCCHGSPAMETAPYSERSYAHMVAFVLRQPYPHEYRRVVRSLEQLQGQIRIELLEMEARAKREFQRSRAFRVIPPNVLEPARAAFLIPDLQSLSSPGGRSLSGTRFYAAAWR